MRKKVTYLLLAAMVVLAVGSITAIAGNGNNLPSGPHFNLNLIGMEKGKNSNMGCGEGRRIFVKLGKESRAMTKIMLQEGDFSVIDCDGTDGTAKFQLPGPDPNNTGTTEYSVFIRLLGKPGGDIKMGTCATDPLTGEEVCSGEVIELGRGKGKGHQQKFINVSKELLYVYANVCVATDPDTGECTAWEYMRVPLFSDILEDYLWQYNNNGVKLVQLRFYPNFTTDVPDVP